MIAKVFLEIEEEAAMKDITIKRLPPRLDLPRQTRKDASQYHFEWGMALLEENDRGLWKDSLALSLNYNPFNFGARYYTIVSFFPVTIRRILIWIYKFPRLFYKTVITRFGIKQQFRKVKERIKQNSDKISS